MPFTKSTRSTRRVWRSPAIHTWFAASQSLRDGSRQSTYAIRAVCSSPSSSRQVGEVAVAEEVVDLAVRPRRVEQGAVARERSGGLLERRVRRLRVQRAQRGEQAMLEDDVATAAAPERPAGAEHLLVRVDGLPAELGEELDGGTLDELVLGEPLRAHAADSSRSASRSSFETSIAPVTSFGSSRSRMPSSDCSSADRALDSSSQIGRDDVDELCAIARLAE